MLYLSKPKWTSCSSGTAAYSRSAGRAAATICSPGCAAATVSEPAPVAPPPVELSAAPSVEPAPAGVPAPDSEPAPLAGPAGPVTVLPPPVAAPSLPVEPAPLWEASSDVLTPAAAEPAGAGADACTIEGRFAHPTRTSDEMRRGRTARCQRRTFMRPPLG